MGVYQSEFMTYKVTNATHCILSICPIRANEFSEQCNQQFFLPCCLLQTWPLLVYVFTVIMMLPNDATNIYQGHDIWPIKLRIQKQPKVFSSKHLHLCLANWADLMVFKIYTMWFESLMRITRAQMTTTAVLKPQLVSLLLYVRPL